MPPAICVSVQAKRESWLRELEKEFQSRHMEVVDNRFLSIRDDIAVPWTLQHMMGAMEVIEHLESQNKDVSELKRAYQMSLEELQHGASTRTAIVSICGRKPRAPGMVNESSGAKNDVRSEKSTLLKEARRVTCR